MAQPFSIPAVYWPQIAELYRGGKSIATIGAIYGVSATPIATILKRVGVESRPRSVRRSWTLERLRLRCRMDDECWLWTGAATGKGFGYVNHEGKTAGVCRVAWELSTGRAPVGLDVWTSCGNSLCCNPPHLECGSRLKHMREIKARGRISQGPRHSFAVRAANRSKSNVKLTIEGAREIRVRAARSESTRIIAAEHGVCESTVQKIVAGSLWREDGVFAQLRSGAWVAKLVAAGTVVEKAGEVAVVAESVRETAR